MRTLTRLLLAAIFAGGTGCGGDNPAPQPPITLDAETDAGADADVPDTESADLGFVDPLTVKPDDPVSFDDPIPVVSLSDAGIPDGTFDSGLPALPDADADSISDADEGDGAIDTDSDGTPDSLDTDSDGDGIDDLIEAGDPDVRTAPVDTDNDGTPDYRDLDSDGDGLSDETEGLADPDEDLFPAFIDEDTDGDAIADSVEGTVDTDSDGTADYLDRDSDGDGIDDLDETDTDTDNDGTGNWRDLESDGDGISDEAEGISDPDGDDVPAFIDLDADGDTLLDSFEGTNDADNDGVGNWLDQDSDGDTIADADELVVDPDGDMLAAFLDLDSDNDTIPDRTEAGDADPATAPFDPDLDGTPSYLDLDSDNDSIFDATEGAADPDGDGTLNFVDTDADDDGLLDSVEAGDTSLLTAPIDSDLDGIDDYLDVDSDNDLILDLHEGATDGDADDVPDYLDSDSDNDGRPDAIEAGDAVLATVPIDTDSDSIADFRDIDSDNDGFGDGTETGCPASTDHLAADSDTDGLSDPIEIAVGTDPCDVGSTVDGLFFVLAPLAGTTSRDLPFDDTDIDRADLVLNVDTTGSMGDEIDVLGDSLNSLIIPGLQAAVTEPAFAVTSFEDYPVDPFGAADVEDRPFRLLSRVTTDAAAAQAAVDSLDTRNGLDLPEAGLESLYQIATGAGTAWGPSSDEQVAPFDNAVGLLPGVADGSIGGVGFRADALPIIVYVTNATSHFASTYTAVSPAITAVPTPTVRQALENIGARVISIVSEPLPRPIAATETDLMFEQSCQRETARFFSRIESPAATDIDWFELTGVAAGATVTAETFAERIGSTLDSVLAVYDATGARLALNDNFEPGVVDSRLSVTLAGTAPFYVAVSSYNDLAFDGGPDALTSGYYFIEVSVDGVGYTTADPSCPGIDLGITRADATALSPLSSVAAGGPTCASVCSTEIADEPLALPYGISQSTGAVILPCAWDAFGVRPASCAPDQCCTGQNGSGQTPNAAGECPLTFEVSGDGVGLGDAVVTSLDALVQFSTFEFTTVVRGDPDALTNDGIDTRCFIHDIVPTTAAVPNACAPTPVAIDNRWTNVVPGTELGFRVDAENRVFGTNAPCVDSAAQPLAFTAFIDVVADGVTVVDTQTVTIVVPTQPTVP